MSSTVKNLYGHLKWETVIAEVKLDVADERCSQLNKTIPIYSIFHMLDDSREIAFNYLHQVCNFSEPEVDQILTVCEDIQAKSPPAKRRKVEENCPAPSTVGDPRFWQTGSEVTNAISNHRCFSVVDAQIHGLPVVLQCKEFGEFEDILGSESDDHHEYLPLALELMLKMSHIYSSESDRVKELEVLLGKNLSICHESQHRAFRTDFCIQHGGVILGNIEVKNELGIGGKAPNLQQAGYFIKLREKDHSSCPMLLMSVVGPDYFQVFGAAWNGGRVCIDPLTEPLSLLYVPHRTDAIERVARVLHAMDVTVKKLSTQSSVHPYFTFNSRLEYIGNLQENKTCVWKAKMKCEDSREVDVIVKFSKRYGETVHRALASQEMAPTVHHIEPLPGGWFAVIMDYVEGKTSFNSILSESEAAKLESFKAELAKTLREKKFVHGDLRPQNIIHCGSGTFKVVDFDWAGAEQQSKYPLDINMRGGWAEGVEPGGIILHEHDLFQLKLT